MPTSEPEILAAIRGEQCVRLEMRVPRDLSWFQGHFPDCPLLPGVIQLTWAVQFARVHLRIPPGFHSLSTLKFMRFILPGAELALLLEFNAARRELSFEYRESGELCSAGKVGFGAVRP